MDSMICLGDYVDSRIEKHVWFSNQLLKFSRCLNCDLFFSVLKFELACLVNCQARIFREGFEVIHFPLENNSMFQLVLRISFSCEVVMY